MSVHQPVPPASPPRSKRRWRYLAGFLLLAIATPFGFYHVGNWLRDRELEEIYREMDAEDPNWRWADLIAELPAPPPDERNAAVQVMKVGELLSKSAFPRGIPTLRFRNARLSDESLASHGKDTGLAGTAALDEARKLKDMPEGRVTIYGGANPLSEPTLKPNTWLTVLRLLQYDAVLRCHERNMDGAADSCMAMLRAVRAIEDYPNLIGLMMYYCGQGVAVEAIEFTLGQGDVSKKHLQSFQDQFSHMAHRNVLYNAFRGERAAAHQYYLMLQAGEIEAEHGPTSFKDRLARLMSGWHKSDYASDLRMKNEQVRVSKLRDAAQIEAQRGLEARISKHSVETKTAYSWGTTFSFVITEYHRGQARVRCAIVALAAERYRLERGAFPNGMAELVRTGFLKEALPDPYDSQPLRWKRAEDYVVVYSVGEKKIDDGGKLNAFNTRDNGLGFVLWMPHLRHVAPPEIEAPAKKKKK